MKSVGLSSCLTIESSDYRYAPLVYSASMPEQANLKFFFLENSNSTSLRGVARRLFKSRPVESKEKPM